MSKKRRSGSLGIKNDFPKIQFSKEQQKPQRESKWDVRITRPILYFLGYGVGYMLPSKSPFTCN